MLVAVVAALNTACVLRVACHAGHSVSVASFQLPGTLCGVSSPVLGRSRCSGMFPCLPSNKSWRCRPHACFGPYRRIQNQNLSAAQMISARNLGTASCDVRHTPESIVNSAIAEWLSLQEGGKVTGKLRVISVDMDGTIADTTLRERYAIDKTGVGPQPTKGIDNAPFFNVFLQGELYHMDTPIPGAVEFLNTYVAPPVHGLVVYLSGRRHGTEEQSREWCRRFGFPDGVIIHRRKGLNSQLFKTDFLQAVASSPLVASLDAHVGDRESDDGGAAMAAGIPFIHVVHEIKEGGPPSKPWPKFEEWKCMRREQS